MSANPTRVVITGAASGLGLAIASKFIEQGTKVALIDKDAVGLRKAVERFGELASPFVCDVRDLVDVNKTYADVLSWSPHIDVLVNNAGVWTDNQIEANDPARRRLAFETNAIGNIQVVNEFLPTFQTQNSGHIFNVISVSADAMSPSADNRLWSTYGATKWALAGFTKTLRETLAGTGIKVSGFFPGGIDTNFYENAGMETGIHEQPWMMKAQDVADIVHFALTRPYDVHIESMTVVKSM